jgi:hypothetical protein
MLRSRVVINYRPRLYRDLFKSILQSLGPIQVVDAAPPAGEAGSEEVDLIILPLDEHGLPEIEELSDPTRHAKVVAFSPSGEVGYRRQAGQDTWEELRPYGMRQLLREVELVP